MRLAFLTSVGVGFLLGALAAPCGPPGPPCCSDGFCSDGNADCVNGTCVVVVPGQGACIGLGTHRGELCCKGNCDGEELSCSEGTCVNVNEDPVFDQSGFQPGEAGGKCIGADNVCDEDENVALECIDGFCKAPQVKDQTAGETCGNMNEGCCYASDDAPLCMAGLCAPRTTVTDPTDIKQFPCVCSSTICVKNVEFCPDGAVCNQSADDLEDCGLEGDPCCDGYGCDEDINLRDDVYIDLICNRDFFDGETGQSTRCERPPDVLVQSFDGCGNAFEKCCSGERCDDDEMECRFGACLPPANCSLAGDRCCDGDQCAHEFLRCNSAPGSPFDSTCLQCGGEAEQCCMDSNHVEYCTGSNMRCDIGVCIMTPGPCDQNHKGCCVNIATGARYCATLEEERLACNIAAEQDSDSGPKCEYCGYENQPCCFPSNMDAEVATSWQVAMAPSPCNNVEQASEKLACMFDTGSADHFNRCVRCGKEVGDPCCWAKLSESDPSVANTAWDVMVPSCEANLACQEFLASDLQLFTDASNYYRCVEASDIEISAPLEGACGGKGQPCCSTGKPSTQCGSGLTCNLDAVICEGCGGLDQLCCPGASLSSEMQHAACRTGLGCSGELMLSERKCTQCGSKGAPCCWNAESGFSCSSQGLQCTASETGTMECT